MNEMTAFEREDGLAPVESVFDTYRADYFGFDFVGALVVDEIVVVVLHEGRERESKKCESGRRRRRDSFTNERTTKTQKNDFGWPPSRDIP